MVARLHCFVLLLGGVVLLTSCAVPVVERTPEITIFSDTFVETLPRNQPLKYDWWKLFNDQELNSLVTQARSDNLTLAQARARIDQALALARREGAALPPSLSLEADRTVPSQNSSNKSTTVGLSAGYVLDIWGKNIAGYRAQGEEALAVKADADAAVMAVISEIVSAWLNLLALKEEEALLRQQIETNKTIFDLQKKRFMGGSTDALDVLQQQEVLARAETKLPDNLAQQELWRSQIALLAGKPPSQPVQTKEAALPAPPPMPEAGLSAYLLQDRPDIRAAWHRILSTDWAVQEAKADRFPNISLSAGLTTTSLSDFIELWSTSFIASLTAPVFDGGLRRAELDRQKAIADERIAAYINTVHVAIKDVVDSMAQEKYQLQTIDRVGLQLKAARAVFDQAQNSYLNGGVGYIDVLSSLISVQDLEQQLIQERRDLVLLRVDLYNALGGVV